MDLNEFLKIVATKLKVRVYTLPMEQFKNSLSEGFGIRCILGDTGKAFRLNFDSKNATLSNIESIDFWNGTSHDPNLNMQIDNLQEGALNNLALKVVDMINAPQYGEHIELNPSEADGDNTTHIITKQGGNDEEYAKTRSEKELSDQMGELSFGETLKDLRSLVVSLVKGVSNALFVYGRGGTGKTTVIEKTLDELGLHDGDGYFQAGGNIGVPDIYKSLFNNKDGILLFDDMDSVFGDESGRNIIKAATDSKKKRKISYLKQSSWAFDPNKVEVTEDELGITKFPNSFIFEGQVIFVSNLQLDQLDPDGSIRTRSLIIGVNPSNDELTKFMESILDEVELEGGLQLDHDTRVKCFKLVKDSTRQDDLSIRKLVRVMNFAASGVPNWERLALLYA